MTNEQSDAFVFLGATGDLAYKQIFPALEGEESQAGLRTVKKGFAGICGQPFAALFFAFHPRGLHRQSRQRLEKPEIDLATHGSKLSAARR